MNTARLRSEGGATLLELVVACTLAVFCFLGISALVKVHYSHLAWIEHYRQPHNDLYLTFTDRRWERLLGLPAYESFEDYTTPDADSEVTAINDLTVVSRVEDPSAGTLTLTIHQTPKA